MKIGILISFLFLFKPGYSQALIPDAFKVKSAFDDLSTDTSSKKLQKLYVASFPATTEMFLNVFHTEKLDQLTVGSNKYLEAFQKCAARFPKKVIHKCVDIGKNLVWDADAVGQLRQISVALAIKHAKSFIDKYEMLDDREQEKLIAFYADVENHSVYFEYQRLIDKFKFLGEKDIAKKLEVARINRQKKESH